ncbi:hypothetical protein F2Q69_00050142 [Brassica cretica]|uniref:Uncharacterized protein n=1 Tax=Brassica cretica TaxID=69181 RepID=A0A8S9PYH5_BRACR|nr:hypothetical protein F2Q69_00050142 [Brassica cretica]
MKYRWEVPPSLEKRAHQPIGLPPEHQEGNALGASRTVGLGLAPKEKIGD